MKDGKDTQDRHNVEAIEAERLFEADPSSDSEQGALTEEATPAPIEAQELVALKVVNKRTPISFKFPNELAILSPKLEKALFKKLQENGNTLFTRTILSDYCTSVLFAICKKISNDSYAVGNEDNSGKFLMGKDGRPIVQISREELLQGITEGRPSNDEINKMIAMIKAFHETPLELLDKRGNGTKGKGYYLLSINDYTFGYEKEDHETKPIDYTLSLHPKFYQILQGFGEHPQGIIPKLLSKAKAEKKRLTGTEKKLLAYLGRQSKDSKIGIVKLTRLLGIYAEFKKNRQRVEDYIEDMLKRFKAEDVGVIKDYDYKKGILYFKHNPNYGKVRLK